MNIKKFSLQENAFGVDSLLLPKTFLLNCFAHVEVEDNVITLILHLSLLFASKLRHWNVPNKALRSYRLVLL